MLSRSYSLCWRPSIDLLECISSACQYSQYNNTEHSPNLSGVNTALISANCSKFHPATLFIVYTVYTECLQKV